MQTDEVHTLQCPVLPLAAQSSLIFAPYGGVCFHCGLPA